MTTINTDNYYRILGVQKTASLEDIKKAYREKAKVLHPDRNKSADAHEDFILLNEAYEYLQDLKTGKLYTRTKRTDARYARGRRTTEDWAKNEREKARERAKAYAKMRYEEFTKTEHYKSIESLNTIASHLGFFIAIAVVVILPVITTILYGVNGIGAALLINFLMLPVTVPTIRNSPSLNMGEFSDSLLYIIKTNVFLIATLTAINIFIVLKFGLQTLISPWLLLAVHGIAIVIVYLINRSKLEKFRLYFYSCCVAPLVINSLLLINFIFSFNPVKETYAFQNDVQTFTNTYKYRPSTRSRQESTYIYLENNAYDAYPGIRVFLDYEAMRYRSHVTYTFKKGILGLRVMTAYEFN